jgi:hypothetical protein
MFRRIRTALVAVLALTASLGAQARTGSISGRIQSQDGSPAAGIRVAAVAAGDLLAFTLTDDAGRYTIDDIPPGRYLIAAGRIGSFTYLPGTTDERKATTLSIAAGSITGNLNFKLAIAAGVRIRGVVGIPTGNFPRTRVATLTGKTLKDAEPVDSAVKDDGSFEFAGVLPGNYEIEFQPTGQAIRIAVADANIDNIRVKAPAVVTGRILVEDGGPVLTSPSQVNAASTFLRIATFPADGSGNSYHPITGSGTFAFTLPADVTYGIEVYDLPLGYYVRSIRSGTADVLAAKGITLNDNLTPKDLVIVLTKQRPLTEPAGVTVRGRVTAAQAMPAGLQVVMTMTPALYHSGVRVENDGSFVFQDVQPGIYTASLAIPGKVSLNKAVVVGNTNVDDLTFVIEPEISLGIRVRVSNSPTVAPPPPVGVRFARSDGRQFRSVTNRDGTLMATLPEGIYQATVGSLPARYRLESVTYGSEDAAVAMRIEASMPPSELVITLRDRESP